MKYREIRHPKTTQEIRENCYLDRSIHARRRNLPTSWDDIFIKRTHSWKNNRKKQYRQEKNCKWRLTVWEWKDKPSLNAILILIEKLRKHGYFYHQTFFGLEWYGPDLE